MQHSAKRIVGILIIVSAVITVSVLVTDKRFAATESTPVSDFILIDAGHGGPDGGASTVDGTLEKDINLAIATHLRDVLTVFGVPVDMTRESDVSIHDEGCTTIREKKVSDMHNRLQRYDQAALTVSIHQNHFSVAKYHGTQVFYSSVHPQSNGFAKAVYARIISLLQPNNTRQIKQTTKDMFLFANTRKPAILVECGFLSNPKESELLKTTSYQQQMALAIAVGVLDGFEE